MSGVLGIGIGAGAVHAVQVARGRLLWAAAAEYAEPGELVELIGRLAADTPVTPRRTRIVLERGVVQLRSTPAPPLARGRARRFVALEASRLFRQNGGSLVTDAVVFKVSAMERVLWAGGAPESIARAAVEGLEQAGLALETLGPAADVLPAALAAPPAAGELVFPNGATSEVLALANGRVWRSRLLRGADGGTPAWAAPLAAIGDDAAAFAAAYGAAVRAPVLDLLPVDARARKTARLRRHTAWLGGAAALLCLLAGGVHVARLATVAAAADRELGALAPAVDSALVVQRDLGRMRDALRTMARVEAGRSRTLALLADLTAALDDSVFLSSLTLARDSTLRLVGYAPQAAGVVAVLERLPTLSGARLEGAVTRERRDTGGGVVRELDRFSMVARLGGAP